MSLSAAHVAAFIAEATSNGSVWAIRDSNGYPAPKGSDGERAMPFWSTRSRAQKIIDTVPSYAGFEPDELELQRWLEKWLPGLEKDGLKIGLNWYGDQATGWHLSSNEVEDRFRSA